MSENDKDRNLDKDSNNFEFIKEQVIVKKRKKIKKLLLPILTTVFLAILFGLIAAVTFILTEPRLSKLLHKEEDSKTPITFPTEYPDGTDSQVNNEPEATPKPEVTPTVAPEEPRIDTVVVEKKIEADIKDFVNMYDDIRNVISKTSNSLVNISSIISGKDLFGNPIDRTIETTGVVIYNDNKTLYILVSLDRVKDASSIKLVISDAVVVDAALQDYESELNLAVVTVPIEQVPAAYINSILAATLGESYTLNVASPIIALGSPNGHNGSVELGIITSKGSSFSITDNKLDLFNTSIMDNDNSDGVIVNMKGEIIGLITRTLKEDVNRDVNTVIGISRVKSIIEQLANKSPRIYFGVKTKEMTESVKTEHEVLNGIYVNEVIAKSPAFEAGFKNGDIILRVNDQPIVHINNFYNAISGYKAGDEIKVLIKRTSGSTKREMELTVILAEKEK
jgi:serine protease Do